MVSAGLIITDVGQNQTRQGRILTSNIPRSTALNENDVSIAHLESTPLYEAKPLSSKARKTIWLPVDYSSSDLITNLPSTNTSTYYVPADKVNGLLPIVVTTGCGADRPFTIEIVINFEVIPDKIADDNYAFGITSFLLGSYD